MKKTLWLTLIFSGFLLRGLAQTSIEFIPAAGYTFPDKIRFDNTYGRLGDAVNFGGSVQFNFSPRFGLELMYNRVDATAKMFDYGNQPSNNPYYQTRAGINYIMAGPVMSARVPGSPVHLFFGPLVGAGIYTPGPEDGSSNVGFAWGVQTGTNIYFTPRLGLRLSARLLTATSSNQGSGYFLGRFGDENNGGYYNNPAIYQFGLSAGLIIGLGSPLHRSHRPARQYRRMPAPPPAPRRYYYYN